MPVKLKSCRYCSQRILLSAKVCQYCGRHQNKFWQHFRIEQIGLFISIITILIAFGQLNEATKKRVEATAALERVEKAELIVHDLQNVLKDAQNTISELKTKFEFSILQIKASNDDRESFERLVEISELPSPLQDLAWNNILQIKMDIENRARKIYIFASHRYNINPSEMSLEEFKSNYHILEPIDKPDYLDSLWFQQRFSKFDRLQFLYDVIKTTRSLRELHKACELMNFEAKLTKSFVLANEYLQWWEQNRSKYESSAQ
jgi:hypothetical protein